MSKLKLAFPSDSVDGMTLRDYFADKAMDGLLYGVEEPAYDNIARMSYLMADAMIEAREVK